MPWSRLSRGWPGSASATERVQIPGLDTVIYTRSKALAKEVGLDPGYVPGCLDVAVSLLQLPVRTDDER